MKKKINQYDPGDSLKMLNIYVIGIPKVGVLEKYLKKYGQNCDIFEENSEPVNMRIPMNPKHNKQLPQGGL